MVKHATVSWVYSQKEVSPCFLALTNVWTIQHLSKRSGRFWNGIIFMRQGFPMSLFREQKSEWRKFWGKMYASLCFLHPVRILVWSAFSLLMLWYYLARLMINRVTEWSTCIKYSMTVVAVPEGNNNVAEPHLQSTSDDLWHFWRFLNISTIYELLVVIHWLNHVALI